MSLNGWRQVRLERQRQEQLRREQVRSQARALLAACRNEMAAITDPAVQQLARAGLRSVEDELERASTKIEQQPDQSLKEIRAAQEHLHRVIADAEAATHRWSEKQAASKARIAEVGGRIEAGAQCANRAAGPLLTRAKDKIAQAASLHQAGRYAEALTACDEAEAAVEQAAKTALDETVRREVVRGLLLTLQGMGFVVQGPQIRDEIAEGGVVTLVGRMPSGRRARFDVTIDGRMSFDFDGFPGRSCGVDLERIGQSLQKRFGVKLGPPQVTWKNPERIAKGACDLPSSGSQHIACR